MAEEKKAGMGLLPKLIMGIFIPILLAFLIIGTMIFFTISLGSVQVKSIKDIGFDSLNELSALALKESTSSLNKLGEKAIQDKIEAVAREMEIFIKAHPKAKKDELFKDPQFAAIAVQKVGETGYTAIHDTLAINYFHNDPKVVGMDLSTLAPKLPDFWKIVEAGLKSQGPSSGYYNWKDPDGKIRQKFMYITPIKGTNLFSAATTYIDEFSKPAKAIVEKLNQIQKRYTDEYTAKFRIFYIVVLLVLVILLVVIYIYAFSIIRPIRLLSEIADKISMGDLKTAVDVKATGEVAVLAESIERMQTSVKAAIERLQRRRSGE